MTTSTLPTTTVQAYVATDGSLWLDEDSCLDHNLCLAFGKLRDHIERTSDYTRSFDSEEVAEYIRDNFDEIKAILGK